MENNKKLEEALKRYDTNAFTHNYIIVAKHWKQTSAYYVDWNIVKQYAKIESGVLKLNITKDMIKTLMTKAWKIEPLGGEHAIEEATARINASGKNYNKGNGAEALMFEKHGQAWEWDNVPYTDGPDIWLDGVPYQIKTYKARFTTLKALGL